MIFQKKKTAIDWLIVGLGNPGMAYEHTRHNAGIDALTVLAKDHGIDLNKKQFATIHAADEHIGIENIGQCVVFYKDLIKRF